MSHSASVIIHALVPIVEFIGRVMGPHCEVVLHDLSVPDSSVVAIANSISGRNVGSPLTPLALKLINCREYTDKSYIINYEGFTSSDIPTRSATYFIKDEAGELIGLLCVNIDINKFSCLKKSIDEVVCSFFGDLTPFHTSSSMEALSASLEEEEEKKYCFHEKMQQIPDGPERFFGSVNEMMQNIAGEALKTYSVPPDRLSAKERKEFIATLKDNGFFLLRGGIDYLAELLKVSGVTIYRDLRGLSNGEDKAS